MPDRRAQLTAVGGRGWRARAAVHRRLTGAADPRVVRALRPPRGIDLPEWLHLSSERHDRYRAEHAPADGRVAIACVSRRPANVGAVIEAVGRQVDVDAEFVFVPNGPHWGDGDGLAAITDLDRTTVVRGFESESLGTCLNAAIDATDARFVAKFDDDDHYGPGYLEDALRAHAFAGAGVVGKHTYYADVDGVTARQLRFSGHEFGYSSTLAGGTLVIDRERTGDLRFEPRSLGEDRALIRACHRRGVSTYAADRFNFVQHRGVDNTWQLGVDGFLAGCSAVDRDAPEHEVDR